MPPTTIRPRRSWPNQSSSIQIGTRTIPPYLTISPTTSSFFLHLRSAGRVHAGSPVSHGIPTLVILSAWRKLSPTHAVRPFRRMSSTLMGRWADVALKFPVDAGRGPRTGDGGVAGNSAASSVASPRAPPEHSYFGRRGPRIARMDNRSLAKAV